MPEYIQTIFSALTLLGVGGIVGGYITFFPAQARPVQIGQVLPVQDAFKSSPAHRIK